jgi:dihydropteroate synthase
MFADGADLVDVGGESTRPGSLPVPAEEQVARVVPVLSAILERRPGSILSVDTTSSVVAGEALRAGASVVNDTSALADDPLMADAVCRTGAAVILMHRRGAPRTMQDAPSYRCFMKEMVETLEERARLAVGAGIDDGRILLDPGIGFGKRPEDNLEAHRHLGDLCALGHPVVFGSSRKAFLGEIDGKPPRERLHTSLASAVVAAVNGASVLRVHDVAPARQALDLVAALRPGKPR